MQKKKSQHIYINLLKKDNSQRINSYLIISFGLVSMVLLSVIIYTYWWQKNELNSQLALKQTLNEQIKDQQMQYTSLQEQLQVKKILDNKQKNVAIIEERKKSYLDVLEEISKALPNSIVMNSMEIKPDIVRLVGYSPNHSQVAVFLYSLKESNFFENVNLITSRYDEEVGEGNFIVEMSWRVKS